MGACFRIFERRIEKELLAQKSRGWPLERQPDRIGDSRSAWQGRDLRSLLPPLGLREYWYPAVPAKRVGKRPFYWNMLGDDLVFFRDKAGEIAAMTDICPHRGASLSEGACYYRGYLSCPYHGATFDRRGECVAFLTEGPESKMVGELKARTYPTRVIRGWIFVWMGEETPAPVEEDVPPEFFETGNVVLSTYTYWHTNWLLAIENHSDSHNAFYLHRNSLKQLVGISTGRTRTPVGPQGKIVNGRGITTTHTGLDYYAKNGKVPYQMYYPGVDGVWPRGRLRLRWKQFLRLFVKRRKEREHFKRFEEWGLGHHLPCAVRTGGGSTRYAVAVRPNLARIIYFYFPRVNNKRHAAVKKGLFRVLHGPLEFNFSSQDGRAGRSCRFWTPEYLAPTDSQVVLLRKLITEYSRDALRKHEQENGNGTMTIEEQRVH